MLSVILKSVDMLSFIVLSAALPNKNQNAVQFRVLHIDIKICSSTECNALAALYVSALQSIWLKLSRTSR